MNRKIAEAVMSKVYSGEAKVLMVMYIKQYNMCIPCTVTMINDKGEPDCRVVCQNIGFNRQTKNGEKRLRYKSITDLKGSLMRLTEGHQAWFGGMLVIDNGNNILYDQDHQGVIKNLLKGI